MCSDLCSKMLSRFFIYTFIVVLFGTSYGLERTKLSVNTANLNLLLSESGRDPNQQGSTNNNNGAQTGRVHSLVDFYNNQGKVTNPPLKSPSYSSIVSGSTQGHPNNGVNTAVTSSSQNPKGHSRNDPTTAPTKPQTPVVSEQKPLTPIHGGHGNGGIGMNSALPNQNSGPGKINPVSTVTQKPSTKPTFSEIVSGGNRRNSGGNRNNEQSNKPQSPTNPTPKPSLSTSTIGGFSVPTLPGNRPSSTPVLPSAILGNQHKVPVNSNRVSDLDLQTLSEELLRRDTNNAAKLITVNYQEKTTADSKVDKAPQPLLSIPASVYNIPTIAKFVPLLDNYERDTLVNEYVTPQERNEENAFMDAIMQTQVIRQLMTFLKDRGYVTPDPRQQRDFLKQLWFSLYSRGKGKISSSGFEHIFVSELKNGEVSGLHNWLYFGREEAANRANYLGYLKYTPVNDKGAVLKLHFTQQGVDKPVDSMFVGTSPELEIALYSLCFITRADQECPLKLGGENIKIVTHTFRYRSKNLIGSAYPQIA